MGANPDLRAAGRQLTGSLRALHLHNLLGHGHGHGCLRWLRVGLDRVAVERCLVHTLVVAEACDNQKDGHLRGGARKQRRKQWA